jgi:hypothetical protein
LVFLFREVLKKEFEGVDAMRAKQSRRLPVVLSVEEMRKLLVVMTGEEAVMAKSAKEDLGLKAKRRGRGERGGRRGEFDCMALLASWRFIFSPPVAMIRLDRP